MTTKSSHHARLWLKAANREDPSSAPHVRRRAHGGRVSMPQDVKASSSRLSCMDLCAVDARLRHAHGTLKSLALSMNLSVRCAALQVSGTRQMCVATRLT